MKIVTISDLHGHIMDLTVPECDLLLIGGDVCPLWNHNRDFQRGWLEYDFANWLKEQPAKEVVGIAGNHDFVLESNPYLGYELPWTYLKDEWTTVGGLKIHGSPWSTLYGNWAFMKKDENLARIWEIIPDDVDILMTHTPMYSIGDKVRFARPGEDPHVGSKTLKTRIEGLEDLKLFVFGHIHEGYGKTFKSKLTCVNPARCDESYDTFRDPIVVEL